jgi:putative transposase
MSEIYKTPEKEKAYFVTFTIVEWIKVLQDVEYKMILVNAIKFYQQNRGLLVYAYCIMPNHIHMIIQSNGEETVSEVLRDLKKFTSKEIIKKLQTGGKNESILSEFRKAGEKLKRIKNYKVWQDGNQAKVLYSNKFIWQKLNYIHNNPVKAGLAERPEEYMFSSVRNYMDLDGFIDVIRIAQELITVK